MIARDEAARRIFMAFVREAADHAGTDDDWGLIFAAPKMSELGLSMPEAKAGFQLLQSKKVADFPEWGDDLIVLTASGLELIHHPDNLDEILNSFQGGRPVKTTHNTTFNAPVGNAQVGNHNTLNVQNTTVSAHFQQLIQEIETSKLEPEKERRLVELLKSLAVAVAPPVVAELFKQG